MSNWIAASGNPFGTNGSGIEPSGKSVYYANGKWIAVGLGGTDLENIWHSSDGISWSASTGSPFGSSGVGNSVYYANGKWVAVGQGTSGSGNNIWHSTTNGISWTAADNQSFGESGVGNSVYYANDKWVAVGVGRGSGNIWYSNDGKSWTASNDSPFGTEGYGNSVYYNGTDKWVAVGEDGSGSGNNIWHSSDGISWTAATGNPFGTNGYGNSVYYNGTDKWVAVGKDGSGEGNNIWHSGNGISWTVATASETGPIFGDSGYGISVYYANDKWVSVGYNPSGSGNIWHSSDGISWTAATGNPFANGNGNSVYYANDKWVAVGRGPEGSGKIWYSNNNGISWTAASGSPFGNGTGISVYYANGIWVAVGNGLGKIWYDGITPPTPTPQVIVDLEIFRLPPCNSVVVVDSLEGRLLTASIAPFNKDLFYAFYVDGVKVLDNITTSEFQYTFPFPGVRMIYITCSSKSTINAYQETIPKTIVTVVVV